MTRSEPSTNFPQRFAPRTEAQMPYCHSAPTTMDYATTKPQTRILQDDPIYDQPSFAGIRLQDSSHYGGGKRGIDSETLKHIISMNTKLTQLEMRFVFWFV